MDLKVDLHTHTTASGHAFPSVYDLCREAKKKGLEGIAITDHSPNFPGGPVPVHFAALELLEREYEGIKMFRGIEANLLHDGNTDAHRDIPELFEFLDFVSVGYHDMVPCDLTDLDRNTDRVITALQLEKVKVLHHPVAQGQRFHIAPVLEVAKKVGVAIEFNSKAICHQDLEEWMNLAEMAKKVGNLISVSSDAHAATTVGDFEVAADLARVVGIDHDKIVNRTLQSTYTFLGF